MAGFTAFRPSLPPAILPSCAICAGTAALGLCLPVMPGRSRPYRCPEARSISTPRPICRNCSKNSSPRNQWLHTLVAMRDAPLTITADGRREGVTVLSLNGPLTLQNIFAFQEELGRHEPQLLI